MEVVDRASRAALDLVAAARWPSRLCEDGDMDLRRRSGEVRALLRTQCVHGGGGGGGAERMSGSCPGGAAAEELERRRPTGRRESAQEAETQRRGGGWCRASDVGVGVAWRSIVGRVVAMSGRGEHMGSGGERRVEDAVSMMGGAAACGAGSGANEYRGATGK
jgi:hypothetical protein